MSKSGLLGFAVAAAGVLALPCRAEDAKRPPTEYDAYRDVITKTAAMVGDREAQSLARKYGLQILNVTWEDTGRYKNSAVGPNISDMTIQVQHMDPRSEKFTLYCMPVIRYPNFTDKTGDIAPDRFFLLVGNEKGRGLKKISLKELLADLRSYLTRGDSWKGRDRSMLSEKDTHVLVSAQACFLPVPRRGEATFNPVLFNYQSYEGDPAVLTILASREGTSITVIDNKRDAFQAGRTWGQRLFFNKDGERASLTGKRLSDFLSEKPLVDPKDPHAKPTPEAAGQQGLNMVLLIQVPLKQKNPMRFAPSGGDYLLGAVPAAKEGARKSDVEEAVIGHGKVEGPFTEIDNLQIERDAKYPVRVTVQFYKATSNGAVSEDDMSAIAKQIEKVYKEADYVGSLVVEGETGRPTEHGGPKFEPPDWWDKFWQRHQENIGMTPEQIIEMLRKLYGPNYIPRDEAELLREIKRLKEKGR